MTPTIPRTALHHFHQVLTRPHDLDPNGHVGSAAVLGYFETAVQAFLIDQAGLDLHDGELAAFVVKASADFYALPGFPDTLEVGVGVTQVAGSTVEYHLSLLRSGDEEPCAAGSLVQVFIERASGRPVTLPVGLREVFERHRISHSGE